MKLRTIVTVKYIATGELANYRVPADRHIVPPDSRKVRIAKIREQGCSYSQVTSC